MERITLPDAGSTRREGHLQEGSRGREDQCVLHNQQEQEKSEEGQAEE